MEGPEPQYANAESTSSSKSEEGDFFGLSAIQRKPPQFYTAYSSDSDNENSEVESDLVYPHDHACGPGLPTTNIDIILEKISGRRSFFQANKPRISRGL